MTTPIPAAEPPSILEGFEWSEIVLAYSEELGWRSAHYVHWDYADTGKWVQSGRDWHILKDVTHWMPLPPKP